MSEANSTTGKGKAPATLEFHGQKTVDRSGEILPPIWIHSAKSHQTKQMVTGTGGSRLHVIDQAGETRAKVVSLVDGAKNVVCACSFLIADEAVVKAMLGASERGVRVYLLTASENQLLKEPKTDSEFDAERLQEHISTLKSMAGRVLVRSGEHFHSKFVLADPNEKDAKGILLTANLTSEALTRNVELAVELNAIEIRGLFKQFLIGFWKESSNELLDKGGLSKVGKWVGPYPEGLNELPCTTSGTQTLKSAADTLVESARGEIAVSSFGFDATHETVQRLIAAAKSGKKVSVFARPRPNKSTMEALIALKGAGAVVRGHRWLHAKFLVADTSGGLTGLVMTANLEKRGLDEGFESGVMLDSRDAETLWAYSAEWDDTFPQELLVGSRIGDVKGEVTLWVKDEPRQVSVKEKGVLGLGEFGVKTVEEAEKFTPDFGKVSERGNEIYHQQTFTWTVVAPKPQG